MQQAFGTMPYEWQENVICHLLKMTNSNIGIPLVPVFLCQPTGGRKSRVRDTFGATQGGVTWCFTPLLSLSADQKTKLNLTTAKNDDATIAIHLDEYSTDAA